VARTAVVAIGGNSLIRDQYLAAAETCHHIAAMVRDGWNLAVVHGNGPQVGFILRRSELSSHELHEVPLDVCVADTQGAIGYALQQNLQGDLRRLGVDRRVVTIVTQVEVDPSDPAFEQPSKPIGSHLTEESARLREAEGWAVAEDAGRGWRRVVPSPLPRRIVEEDVIRQLVESRHVVIAAGGGGIPVVPDEEGHLRGVAAVIDKDHAAALLARGIGAELFVISTSVDRVALDFGRPTQRWVDALSIEEAKGYLAEGSHFAEGSMAPKVRAAVWFVEHGGERALITGPDALEAALEGRAGTLIGA
jgi:carbamate kinase